MKRTKQLEVVLKEVNSYLKNNKIKDQGDSVFCVMCHALIQAGVYRGFNMYKDEKFADGTVVSVLAGTSDPEKFDYIQLY